MVNVVAKRSCFWVVNGVTGVPGLFLGFPFWNWRAEIKDDSAEVARPRCVDLLCGGQGFFVSIGQKESGRDEKDCKKDGESEAADDGLCQGRVGFASLSEF